MDKHLIQKNDIDRRTFISNIGKSVALASLSSAYLTGLNDELVAMTKKIDHLTPEEAATDEDFWFHIQQSFSVSRSLINLNNGGVSPSPRIVTEALVRYQWQQENATAYTMWQLMQPQVETIRTGLADLFGCDREEIAITRNASESLEIILMGMDLKSGDEILTTTQDYPRMLTTLRQREQREGISLKLIKIPVPSESKQELVDAFEKNITPKTKVILICHQINLTGQIVPVKEICELGRSKGIEVVVDGAHSFAQFVFKNDEIQCDYFGTSLHKWLYAPKGTGLLYIRKSKISKIWPLMAADRTQVTDVRKFEEIG
ncbi:MAG: aminotransferase class V-fold PLP-dependent enzyme, partial [Ignavibacteriales bacterium]|nr:aminotransferase class V-fold PLP-dependent enzyme [Ignavibacteriales bacterium]